jgi:hypothetical protein
VALFKLGLLEINIEGIGKTGNNMVKGKNTLVHGLRVFGTMEEKLCHNNNH